MREAFVERSIERGGHKGLIFNIISPSNNNFNECAYMHFSSFRNIQPALVLSTVYSCFLECLSVFLGKLSVYKHVQSRGGDKKGK